MDRTSFSKICTLLGLASVVLVVGSSLMGVPAFVLGAVLAVACFVFGLMARKEDGSRKISGGIMFGVMAIFVLLAIAGMSTVQVAAGEKGVIVSSPSGNIGEVIDEGWHFDPAYSFATVENMSASVPPEISLIIPTPNSVTARLAISARNVSTETCASGK